MSKIFVIPSAAGGSTLSCILLKHPKDWSDCVFYIEPKQKQFYELNCQKNRFYSWFHNNSLIGDGNIYTFTPIDPLFLLIPFIYKNTERFQSLYDIFTENNIAPASIDLLLNVYSTSILKCIAEVKDFEGEVFIKFSKEKTLKWLGLKFENAKKSLVSQGIRKNLFGFKVSNYVSGDKPSEDEYRVLAFELITDYICKDLEQLLRDQLSIPDYNKLLASFDNKTTSNKRKLGSDNDHTAFVQSAHIDDDVFERQKPVLELNKKQKISRAQRELNKVDKSGMKSISSYFQKKK